MSAVVVSTSDERIISRLADNEAIIVVKTIGIPRGDEPLPIRIWEVDSSGDEAGKTLAELPDFGMAVLLSAQDQVISPGDMLWIEMFPGSNEFRLIEIIRRKGGETPIGKPDRCRVYLPGDCYAK